MIIGFKDKETEKVYHQSYCKAIALANIVYGLIASIGYVLK